MKDLIVSTIPIRIYWNLRNNKDIVHLLLYGQSATKPHKIITIVTICLSNTDTFLLLEKRKKYIAHIHTLLMELSWTILKYIHTTTNFLIAIIPIAILIHGYYLQTKKRKPIVQKDLKRDPLTKCKMCSGC